MPYNYLDYIRDEYRRNRGRTGTRAGITGPYKSAYGTVKIAGVPYSGVGAGANGDPVAAYTERTDSAYRKRLDAINARAKPELGTNRTARLVPTYDTDGVRGFPQTIYVGSNAGKVAPYGTNLGEPLDYKDTIGNVFLGRQGPGQNEGMRQEDAAAFQRPRRLAGSGITDTEYRALGYNPSDPINYGPSAKNPAPARQAVDAAVENNAKVGNTGSKTIMGDDGYITTFSGDGQGRSRFKLPFGTNVQRTENGHTVLNYANGNRSIVSAEGQHFQLPKQGTIVDNTKDFSNPVLNTEQAGAYLGSGEGSNVLSNLTNNYSGPASVITPETNRQSPTVPVVYRPAETTQPSAAFTSFGTPTFAGLGQATTNVLNRLSKAVGNPRFQDKKDEENQY